MTISPSLQQRIANQKAQEVKSVSQTSQKTQDNNSSDIKLKPQLSKDTFDYSKDDGKISSKDKAKNFLKGVVAPVTAMFKSPKNFLIGLASIAGISALTIATGGAIAPLLVTAGVVGGGIQLGVSAYKAHNATTDEQARQAWQGMGTGTVALVGSVAGAKTAAKAGGIEGAKEMNALKATIACIKNSPKAISKSVKAFTSGQALVNLGFKQKSKPQEVKPQESKPNETKPKEDGAKPKTEPKQEPKTEQKTELKQETKPEAKQELKTEPKQEPKTEPKQEIKQDEVKPQETKPETIQDTPEAKPAETKKASPEPKPKKVFDRKQYRESLSSKSDSAIELEYKQARQQHEELLLKAKGGDWNGPYQPEFNLTKEEIALQQNLEEKLCVLGPEHEARMAAARFNSVSEMLDTASEVKVKAPSGETVNAKLTTGKPRNGADYKRFVKVDGKVVGASENYVSCNDIQLQDLPASYQQGRNAVKVEFLGTSEQYRGTGTELIKAAVRDSVKAGHEGRVFVDACGGSLPNEIGCLCGNKMSTSPVPFYYKLGFRMSDEAKNALIAQGIEQMQATGVYPKFAPSGGTMFLTPEAISNLLK